MILSLWVAASTWPDMEVASIFSDHCRRRVWAVHDPKGIQGDLNQLSISAVWRSTNGRSRHRSGTRLAAEQRRSNCDSAVARLRICVPVVRLMCNRKEGIRVSSRRGSRLVSGISRVAKRFRSLGPRAKCSPQSSRCRHGGRLRCRMAAAFCVSSRGSCGVLRLRADRAVCGRCRRTSVRSPNTKVRRLCATLRRSLCATRV
jgi:hypothetical protein